MRGGYKGLANTYSTQPPAYKYRSHDVSELSSGRMDPRVGSGRVGLRFCRILAGLVGSAFRIL